MGWGFDRPITRRGFLSGAAGVAASLAVPCSVVAGALRLLDFTFDVIVVGGGGAGFSAALGAKRADPSATVLLLEDRPSYGGTSYRSGGRLWIPNNADMRAAGLRDPKEMALRYMGKLSYPDRYDPQAPCLGLDPRHYRQLSAYYANGSDMLDYYRASGIMPWHAEQFQLLPGETDALHLSGHYAPDYHPELSEDVPKAGRSIMPAIFDPTGITRSQSLDVANFGASIYGPFLIEWLHHAATTQGVVVLPGMRMRDLVIGKSPSGGSRVTGVVAEVTVGAGSVLNEPVVNLPVPVDGVFHARRGVIVATGGFSKNPSRVAANFSGLRALTGGGCAVRSAVGDFADLGEKYGYSLENMDQAWFVQNIFEQYMLDPNSELTPNYLLFQAYWLNGDSMLVVNRLGERVFDEKENYNDRTTVHFQSADNRFLLAVFDQHCVDHFAGIGGQLTPAVQTLIGPAASTADLHAQIATRLTRYQETASFVLPPDFDQRLDRTLARFAGFARTGHDVDFHRGDSSIDVWWHALICLTFQGLDVPVGTRLGIRDCIATNVDADGRPYPNVTMRPLAPPYYAVILSSGLQDTKGGPAIDEQARVIDEAGRPVDGLYGAGNCIGSPAGAGYWGAGGTLGPATVFGHIAGRNAATRSA